MGRGNVCAYGKYEGSYYVGREVIPAHFYDKENNRETDEIDYDALWNNMQAALTVAFPAAFMKRFPSFSRCDKWIDRGQRQAILESPLFYICLQRNEWSMAVELIQKNTHDNYRPAFQKRHYQNYLNGIRDCLFKLFPELQTYNGPWTRATIRREDYEKKKVPA